MQLLSPIYWPKLVIVSGSQAAMRPMPTTNVSFSALSDRDADLETQTHLTGRSTGTSARIVPTNIPSSIQSINDGEGQSVSKHSQMIATMVRTSPL